MYSWFNSICFGVFAAVHHIARSHVALQDTVACMRCVAPNTSWWRFGCRRVIHWWIAVWIRRLLCTRQWLCLHSRGRCAKNRLFRRFPSVVPGTHSHVDWCVLLCCLLHVSRILWSSCFRCKNCSAKMANNSSSKIRGSYGGLWDNACQVLAPIEDMEMPKM